MVYNLERTLDRLKQEGKQEGLQEGKQAGLQEGLEKGLEKGMEKGIKAGKYTVAKRLLMKGQDIDTVMDVTELTKEELEQLMKEIKL